MVLFEKLAVAQHVKKVLAFFASRKFIPMSTRAHH